MPFRKTAIFPAAIPTVAQLLNQTNWIAGSTQPTLSAQLLSSAGVGATFVALPSGTGNLLFPADNFEVTIDQEIIFVSSRATDTFTIGARGAEGTTAATHALGAAIGHNLTADPINQIDADLAAIASSLGIYLRNVFGTTVHTYTGSVTLTEQDSIVHMNPSAPANATLPSPTGIGNRAFFIKNISLFAVTVVGTIEGVTNFILVNQYQSVWVYTDGTGWFTDES